MEDYIEELIEAQYQEPDERELDRAIDEISDL